MPEKQQKEASEETVLEIHQLNQANSITAIRSLKSNQKFVKGSKGRDLKLQITIENTESGSQLKANALLDSGATGSCINQEFVKKNHLTV